MGVSEMIGLAALILTYTTAIITIYVQMKVKLKELDIKVLVIQNDLNEFKKTTQCDIREIVRSQERSLEKINEKLDAIYEKIYSMSNERTIKKTDNE